MMTFLAVRCLNCNNVDEFPRMDYDEIPYCSQCSATTNLVPATPPSKGQPQSQQWSGADDLSSLFSRNLSLLDAPVTPPTSPPSINYSVSQHYTHPTTFRPPTPQHQAQLDSQLMSEASSSVMVNGDQEKTYIQYLLTSNLGSDTSSNDLEIALAHGIIDRNEYSRAINVNNQLRQQRGHEALMAAQREVMQQESMAVQQQLFMEMQQSRDMARRGLEENCSAHSLLSASAAQRKDPVFRTAEFFNDYYGGVDASWEEDEDAPCSVYAAGGRLRPFDL